MVNKDSIVDTVLMLPQIRAIGEVSVDDKRKAAEALFNSVKNDILITYDWPFAIYEATESTVADQASYLLKGAESDCRDIINVRYGDDDILLDKRRRVDMDEYLDGRTISSVLFWMDDGYLDDYPKIKLVGTPSTAGETIRYRYRPKDVPLTRFPEQFEKAFILGIATGIVPSYNGLFNKALDRLIDNFDVGGGEDDQVKQDYLVVHRNNRRSTKFGWGG